MEPSSDKQLFQLSDESKLHLRAAIAAVCVCGNMKRLKAPVCFTVACLQHNMSGLCCGSFKFPPIAK